MATNEHTRLWRYRAGAETSDIVVFLNDSRDSRRLVSFLERNEIPFTSVPSDGQDPEDWPDAQLPAIYLPNESRNGLVVIFRGLRQIQLRFLSRFIFEDPRSGSLAV